MHVTCYNIYLIDYNMVLHRFQSCCCSCSATYCCNIPHLWLWPRMCFPHQTLVLQPWLHPLQAHSCSHCALLQNDRIFDKQNITYCSCLSFFFHLWRFPDHHFCCNFSHPFDKLDSWSFRIHFHQNFENYLYSSWIIFPSISFLHIQTSLQNDLHISFITFSLPHLLFMCLKRALFMVLRSFDFSIAMIRLSNFAVKEYNCHKILFYNSFSTRLYLVHQSSNSYRQIVDSLFLLWINSSWCLEFVISEALPCQPLHTSSSKFLMLTSMIYNHQLS